MFIKLKIYLNTCFGFPIRQMHYVRIMTDFLQSFLHFFPCATLLTRTFSTTLNRSDGFPCPVLHRPPIPCALSHRDPSVLLVVLGLPWNGQRGRFGHRKEDWVGGGGHHLAWNGHGEDRCGRTQATVPEPHDSFWNTHTDTYSLPWPSPSEQCLLTTLLLLLTGSKAASVTGTDVH